MSNQKPTFKNLESIDSTNNYAMAAIQEGLAEQGAAYFTSSQTSGKGQRGKQWLGGIGENLAISIVIQPDKFNSVNPFLFSSAVAICCCNFLRDISGESMEIKWPNDIYVRDRKTAGILIENVFRGSHWNWSVVGLGVNVNQTQFDATLKNPISLKQITGKDFDLQSLATRLHEYMLKQLELTCILPPSQLMEAYNSLLYKRDQPVMLKQGDQVHNTVVRFVAENGNLVTDHSPEGFVFGEVEWIL